MIRRTDSIAWICLSHPSCYVPPNLFFPASDHFLFFILPFLYKREPEIFIFISFDIIIFVIEFPYFHAFLFIFTDTTWKERVYKSTFFFTNLWHTAGSRYVNITIRLVYLPPKVRSLADLEKPKFNLFRY